MTAPDSLWAEYPAIGSWSREHGGELDYMDFAGQHLRLQDWIALARCFHPRFIEISGCVIWDRAYEPANFREWHLKFQGDATAVEAMLNSASGSSWMRLGWTTRSGSTLSPLMSRSCGALLSKHSFRTRNSSEASRIRKTGPSSPGQCALVVECLDLASGSDAGPDDLIRFRLGGPRETVAALAEEVRAGSRAELSQDYRFDVRQLHLIYAALTRAVTDFVSDEDFHQRTGWYRENVVALAREMERSLRGILSAD